MNNTKHSILLYLHGNGSDRTNSVNLFEILRKFFYIFAVDYRGKSFKYKIFSILTLNPL